MKQALNIPAWTESTSGSLTICLRTTGCNYAKSTKHSGCLHCELLQLSSANVTVCDILNQLKFGLNAFHEDTFDKLNLLVLGSFLDDREVPRRAIDEIGDILTQTPIKSILLESRPEFITMEKLRFLKGVFKGINVDIAVGVESKNDYIRLNVLKKGFSLADVEMAVSRLANENIGFAGYVLLKPPTLSEYEAIKDAVQTSKYIFLLGERYNIPSRVLLQPYYEPVSSRIRKRYFVKHRPPYLWSIIEVLKQVVDFGIVYVGINDEGLSSSKVQNCPRCTDTALNAIKYFNVTQDMNMLDDMSCPCKSEWLRVQNEKTKCPVPYGIVNH